MLYGQPFSSLLYQPHGRHQISNLNLVQEGTQVLVSSERNRVENFPGSLNIVADLESRASGE